MTRDSRKMRIWTRYFDSKLSRSNGRRVPKEASIPNPSLDAIIWAARDAVAVKGIRPVFFQCICMPVIK